MHRSSRLNPNNQEESVEPLSQRQDFAKTTFIAEGIEAEIENCYLKKSLYIHSFLQNVEPNEELRIILPGWVSAEALKVVLHYLKPTNLDSLVDYENQALIQRLLWLTDFLQIDELQALLLNEKIIPSIAPHNCLLFLSESFKKLKIAKDSSELWYKLFNTSLESLARNLVWNAKNKKADLLETNDNILEEVIERALKIGCFSSDTDQKEIINLLLETQRLKDPIECLNWQREKIIARQLINSDSPNITWKLKNLSQISSKETAVFKFGGLSWKLIAKPKTVTRRNEPKILELYLKYEIPSDVVTLNETDGFSKWFPGYKKTERLRSDDKPKEALLEMDSFPRSGFLSVSYNMKVTGKAMNTKTTIRSCQLQNSPLILLSSLNLDEDKFLNLKETEFTIFLNLEFVYSSLLLHISKNMDFFTKYDKIEMINGNELSVLLQNLELNEQAWSKGIELILSWLSKSPKLPQSDLEEVFDALEWQHIQPNQLAALKESKLLSENSFLKARIESKISTKILQTVSSNSYRHNKSENTPPVNSKLADRSNPYNLPLNKNSYLENKALADNSQENNFNHTDMSSLPGSIYRGNVCTSKPKFGQDISLSSISNTQANNHNDTILSRNVVTENSCITDVFDNETKPLETETDKRRDLIRSSNNMISVPITPEKKVKMFESSAAILKFSKSPVTKEEVLNPVVPKNQKMEDFCLVIAQEEIGNDLKERITSKSTQNNFSVSMPRSSLGSQSHLSPKPATFTNHNKLIQSPSPTSLPFVNPVVITSYQDSFPNEKSYQSDHYRLEGGSINNSKNSGSLHPNLIHTFAAESLSPKVTETILTEMLNCPTLNGFQQNDAELLRSPFQQPPNKLKKLCSGSSRQSLQNSSIIQESSINNGLIPEANSNRSTRTTNLVHAQIQLQKISPSPYATGTSSQNSAKKLSEKMSFKNSIKTLTGSSQRSNEKPPICLTQAKTLIRNEITPFSLVQNHNEADSETFNSKAPPKSIVGRSNFTLSDNKTDGNFREPTNNYDSLESLEDFNLVAQGFLNTVSSSLPLKGEATISQTLPDAKQSNLSPLQEKNTTLVSTLNKQTKLLKINMAEIQANNSLIDIARYTYFISQLKTDREIILEISREKLQEEMKSKKEEILKRIHPKKYLKNGHNYF